MGEKVIEGFEDGILVDGFEEGVLLGSFDGEMAGEVTEVRLFEDFNSTKC